MKMRVVPSASNQWSPGQGLSEEDRKLWGKMGREAAREPRLSPPEKAVLWAILQRPLGQKLTATAIVAMTGLSRDAVRKVIAELTKVGVLGAPVAGRSNSIVCNPDTWRLSARDDLLKKSAAADPLDGWLEGDAQ